MVPRLHTPSQSAPVWVPTLACFTLSSFNTSAPPSTPIIFAVLMSKLVLLLIALNTLTLIKSYSLMSAAAPDLMASSLSHFQHQPLLPVVPQDQVAPPIPMVGAGSLRHLLPTAVPNLAVLGLRDNLDLVTLHLVLRRMGHPMEVQEAMVLLEVPQEVPRMDLAPQMRVVMMMMMMMATMAPGILLLALQVTQTTDSLNHLPRMGTRGHHPMDLDLLVKIATQMAMVLRGLPPMTQTARNPSRLLNLLLDRVCQALARHLPDHSRLRMETTAMVLALRLPTPTQVTPVSLSHCHQHKTQRLLQTTVDLRLLAHKALQMTTAMTMQVVQLRDRQAILLLDLQTMVKAQAVQHRALAHLHRVLAMAMGMQHQKTAQRILITKPVDLQLLHLKALQHKVLLQLKVRQPGILLPIQVPTALTVPKPKSAFLAHHPIHLLPLLGLLPIRVLAMVVKERIQVGIATLLELHLPALARLLHFHPHLDLRTAIALTLMVHPHVIISTLAALRTTPVVLQTLLLNQTRLLHHHTPAHNHRQEETELLCPTQEETSAQVIHRNVPMATDRQALMDHFHTILRRDYLHMPKIHPRALAILPLPAQTMVGKEVLSRQITTAEMLDLGVMGITLRRPLFEQIPQPLLVATESPLLSRSLLPVPDQAQKPRL